MSQGEAQQGEANIDCLQSLHDKLNTPEALISAQVKKATGYDILTRRKIIAGEANEVYDVATQGGMM